MDCCTFGLDLPEMMLKTVQSIILLNLTRANKEHFDQEMKRAENEKNQALRVCIKTQFIFLSSTLWNSELDNKILDVIKMKASADDKINVV